MPPAAKKKTTKKAAEAADEPATTKSKTKKKVARKAKAEAGSRGLPAPDLARDVELPELVDAVVADGGTVIGSYRDPLGSHPTVLAGLPIDRVEPTPFQRDLSAAHVKKLTEVIDKLDWFLDPIVVVRSEDGKYLTPNGNHRLSAMRALGAKSIVALVVPEFAIAYKILALNTEKAHNLREKALEVIRMARSLGELGDAAETAYALEFEEPALLTLGLCYEQRPRFSGGAYNSVLRRVDAFIDEPVAKALEIREARAQKVLELDEAVNEAIERLKAKGLESPYLRAFVVARINPLRWKKDAGGDFDEVIAQMSASAKKFDAGKISADQLASTGGAPEE